MMFQPLAVDGRRLLADADGQQKLQNGLVPFDRLCGEPSSAGGQSNRLVRFGSHQAVPLEPANGAMNRRRGDSELVRQIDDATSTIGLSDLLDRFDVVLGDLRRVITACTGVLIVASRRQEISRGRVRLTETRAQRGTICP